ncbi:hypothetical protein DPMN_113721 [Dreissena polymorpha]|uniref:Uncharacterized protein n=1 Tax=Dreissena polymorpha TaxID=45954 RepID=A0A9D4KIU8_DREPO|nr:hypothetical protein DPMN_113721 [Dreissena polymorpha]
MPTVGGISSAASPLTVASRELFPEPPIPRPITVKEGLAGGGPPQHSRLNSWKQTGTITFQKSQTINFKCN